MELEELNYKMISQYSSNIQLRPKQMEAYNLMVQGKNIFLTGSAGTGKSAIIKMFVNMYQNVKNIGLCSTTGTSAVLIGGTTLHSYTGIGLGKSSVEAITNVIFKKSYLRKRWNKLDILIIDEISMLSPELFDKLEEIARIVRYNNLPFGGIQLILSGDFLQLPCINSYNFCNESDSWKKCIKHFINLTEIIRQDNIEFQNCLNYIRMGEFPIKIKELIESRVGAKLNNDFGIKPTKLYSLNYDVDNINNKELNKLTKNNVEFREYEMEIIFSNNVKNKKQIEENFKKFCTAPIILELCVGAQVMLLWNLDLANQLANGSRGIVIGFTSNDIPIVRFLNGIERVIDYNTWEIEEGDIKAIQIPLKLAYALSIHKAQGISLDYVELDLSNIFEYGQCYTALSRVRSLEGLSIISIDWNKIIAHPKAVEFYKNLK